MAARARNASILVAAAVALLASAAGTARSCTVCIGFPDKTDTDYLIESHCVVLARQAEGNPFAYAPRQALKGDYDGSEITLLVDTMTRRVLATDPERRVILVQEKRGGRWRSLGLASKRYLFVIRRIVAFGDGWKGQEGAEQRWKFFFPLFGHEDRRIRQLAYLEIARAPYAVLKQLGRIAPRAAYSSYLSDPKYIEWRSLAILLLAQSNDPVDHQFIRDNLNSVTRFGITTNLAAWTAAAIEIDGMSAIDLVEEEYFLDTGRTMDETKAVAEALSMHGSEGDVQLQDRIVASYGVLLRTCPEIAPRIAEDLQLWKRAELVDDLSAALHAAPELDFAERQSIRRYLRTAAAPKELALAND